jgi:hypothetical protein
VDRCGAGDDGADAVEGALERIAVEQVPAGDLNIGGE